MFYAVRSPRGPRPSRCHAQRVHQASGPLCGSVAGHALLPRWVTPSVSLQTAFSDFLMGSSKDLAKHIRVVVSRLCPQAGWVGLAGGDPPGHMCSTPSPVPACSVMGIDLDPKTRTWNPQCIVFLNIPSEEGVVLWPCCPSCTPVL